MAAHLYWRINVSANNSSTNTAIAEIEMRATIGGADQCTGGTATASGDIGPSFTADKAFDDNASTMWNTGGVGWIRYQFASAVSVVEYTVAARNDGFLNDSPKDWTLEFSDDGVSFTIEDTQTNQTGWSLGEIRTYQIGASSAEVRVTQQATLVLSAANSDVRVTQAAVLALVFMPDASEEIRVTQTAILALAEFNSGIRVTQTAVLVLADQVNCLTKWAQIWTITRTDGDIFGFTSHDQPITFRGIVHSPCDSLSASAVELSSLTGSTGSMELMGIISDTSVTEADLYNGLFDSASIEVWMVPWDNENGDIPFRLIAGQTGKLSHGVEGFEFEVLANATKLKQKSLIDVYTPGCRYNFGTQNDPRCPVDLTTIDVTGSVTGLAVPNAGTSSTRRIFTDSSRTEADGFFEFGKVTWTSGANTGVVSEVKDFNAKTFVLWNATLAPIAINDTYDATPGCDKSRADHLVFNADMTDYGGFEDVPGTDAVLQTPDAKG